METTERSHGSKYDGATRHHLVAGLQRVLLGEVVEAARWLLLFGNVLEGIPEPGPQDDGILPHVDELLVNSDVERLLSQLHLIAGQA